MRIAVDAMGGDNAPFEVVKGVCIACDEFDNVDYLLVGDKAKINDCMVKLNRELPKNVEILHTDVFVTMDDDPMLVMKGKENCSMRLGLEKLKQGEVDAFVSAGSTGALHTASTLIVRRIKGVRRSAIAAVIPLKKPMLILDSGANPEVNADIINQWAVVGSAYVGQMFGIENPRVGLLNNGTEEHKGTIVVQEAYQMLKNNENINFVGNIESKEIFNCPCDVLVTDGFTGNVTVKLIEGMGKFMFKSIKNVLYTNFLTKISALALKKPMMKFKKQFDASEYGGAPILGLLKPVVKAHGSSNAYEIRSTIKQAIQFHETGIIDKVANALK